MRARYYILCALIFLLALTGQAVAKGIDLHALWDDRCAECHGHSADFARKYLEVVDGRLQGHHHLQNLDRFLVYHYTPAGEADALYAMLLAQVQTPPRYREQCSRCHRAAADLVRQSILPRQGRLELRGSGLGLDEFMQTHRKLSAEEIKFYLRLFGRLAGEIYRP